MLKLKNVSKYYYSKGLIATGFTKISVEFNLGEFVAIVGESGSGKSTLLNVLSGLDSYEEGEMYINDQETSHYRECDFEEYRKKYISNIFQNFNLVNSYTVYQNVELVLLLNGYRKKEIKNKVLSIIDKVGLLKYKNTKVSRLSGGQKQRVAIARALAKESPIIICDEPTGNLDSKSAKEVIDLLHEISHDKLVIVVTHNYDEIKDLATRVIRLHDGKIISDKKNKQVNKNNEEIAIYNKNIGYRNILKLGFRNTFNIFTKFLLIFIVNLFITVSLLTVYSSLKKSEYETSKLGDNYYFSDTSDTRLVIKKNDGTEISENDVEEIKKIDMVDYVIESDFVLDRYLWFESGDENYYSFSGNLKNIQLFDGDISVGRLPENDNEVLIVVNSEDYYFSKLTEKVMEATYYIDGDKDSLSVKVVGVKYLDDSIFSTGDYQIYANSEFINEYTELINKYYSTGDITINNLNYQLSIEKGNNFNIEPSSKVMDGYAYISDEITYTCKDYNCQNKSLSINVENLYYNEKVDLKISKIYTDKTVNSLLGIDKSNSLYGSIFISQNDYNKLYNNKNYQSSVFVKNIDYIDSVDNELQKLGYNTLQIRKTLSNDGQDVAKILKLIKLVVIIGLVITLFFISYFVIKLILKSRQIYFSTLRILGANVSHVKKILDVELFINSSLAYLLYLILILLVNKGMIRINFITNICDYLLVNDYILMYVILICMSYLISTRFSVKVFKKSAMKTYKEEV